MIQQGELTECTIVVVPDIKPKLIKNI